jgi:hypothetical protein
MAWWWSIERNTFSRQNKINIYIFVFDWNQRLFCFLLAITSCINFSPFSESSPLSEQPKLDCDVNLRQENVTQKTRTSLRTETSLCAFYTIINFQINTTHSQPSLPMYNIITSWHVRLEQDNESFLTLTSLLPSLLFVPLLSTKLVTQSGTNQPKNQPATQRDMRSSNHSFIQAHFPVNEPIR